MHRRDLLSALCVAALPSLVRAAQSDLLDVVIVGAGGAGLAAAVAAKEAGAARVLVLEKTIAAGGHTLLSAGSISVPVESSSRDPVAEMAQEMIRAGGDRRLAEVLARESASLAGWLADMGVRWEPRLFQAVGAVSRRNLSPGAMRGGFECVQALAARAKALGAEVHFMEPAKHLYVKDGKIRGVLTESSDGSRRLYEARAVILATGGFGANVALRRLYRPELDGDYTTTADPLGRLGDGATGDGVLMAQRVGARLVDMDAVQLIPYNGGRVLDYAGAEIWLNAEGRRFVNEEAPFSRIEAALQEQTDAMMWALTDAKSQKGANIVIKLASGAVQTADSIEALARGMHLSTHVLQQTLARYNRMVRAGKDADFGRKILTQTIDTPPFYYGVERLCIHMTLGGVAVDSDMHVLDRNGRVMDGLYAAGEVTGGVHGRRRISGNALTEAFAFGRLAGRNAARSK